MSYPFPLILLYPAVFLSGATALVYEIVWTRHLSLVLGSTMEAAAAVLSAFMFGLAFGALAVGRLADSSRRPLRWYGLLEIGIGAYALAFPELLGMAEGSWWAACGLVALPAALMGATLPVLARAAADTTERGTRAFGGLYGVNTLGAVAGALLAVFVLLRGFGLAGSAQLAAAVNIALGLLFGLLSFRAGERPVFARPENAPRPRWRGDAELAVVAVFFMTGFAGLALEMAWTRVLVYFLEGFTIAFGLMLATYLLGLGLGAVGGTFLALRSQNPRRLLGRIVLVQAVLALATFLFVGTVSDRLEAMRAEYIAADAMDASYAFALFLASAVIILPATFFGGMLMPVVARITLSDREAIGGQTGVVYAASTLGAVLAPPAAGFVILPAFGVPGSIALMGAVLLLGGTWLALVRGVREWVFAGAAAVLFVAVFIAADLSTPLIERSHVFSKARTPRRLRVFREGRMAGVSVVEDYKDGSRKLYIDGFSAAETGSNYGYMRMLGHLPVLLHANPENVLVIAFGSGTTAGAVSVHDEVKRVVCVEIEPAVYDVAGEFSAVNRDVLASPKVERVVADGREFVRRAEGRYDVVTLEPLMPYTPAAVYLYTREFYEDVQRSMRPGGVLCQWIPPQGVSNHDLKRLVRSVADVFGHISLWYFPDAVLVIGSDRDPRIEQEAYLRRCAQREVWEDIQSVVGDLDHVLAAHVCSNRPLREALRDVEPMVDDRTDLEFRPLPRRFGKRSQTYHAENLEFLAGIHQETIAWLGGGDVVAAQRKVKYAGMHAALATLAVEKRRRVEGGAVVSSSVLRHVVERDPQGLLALSIYDRRRYEELLARGAIAEAVALQHAPDRSIALLAMATEVEPESPEQALFYRLVALGDNGLLPPKVLRELATHFQGPEKRFCLNRALVQEGKEPEEGPEQRPLPTVPDLSVPLAAGDRDAARDIYEMARSAGFEKDAEAIAQSWWDAAPDKVKATLFLYEIGASRRALLAARKLRGVDERAALAVIFASEYPRIRTWERLCGDRIPRVRAAAADAAAALAHLQRARAFLPSLAILLEDKEESVRLSAFLAFRSIHPEAEKMGYDHRAPRPEAVARMKGLATGKVAAVADDR